MKYLNLFFILITFHFSIQAQHFNRYDSQKDSIAPLPPVWNKKKNEYIKGELQNSVKLSSPNETLELTVNHYQAAIEYSVRLNGVDFVLPSRIDLRLKNDDYITNNLTLNEVTHNSSDKQIKTLYKENAYWHENYKEMQLHFTSNATSGTNCRLIFRIYDFGFAFRFAFPENTSQNLFLKNELTQFSFTQNYDLLTESQVESGYRKTNLTSNIRSELPLLMFKGQRYILINEADNNNFARQRIQNYSSNTLEISNSYQNLTIRPQEKTPWRYVLFADSEKDFMHRKNMVYSLCPQNQLGNIDYIKPGKILREMSLTTDGGLKAIDFCATHNFQYILYDAGWYGLGYWEQFNQSSNPTEVISEIDMQKVIDYGKSKNIGVFLYINKVGMQKYNLETTFALYEKWGVKGVKFGFVDGLTQSGIRFTYESVQLAAKHKLMVNIHDNLRPTGLSRTYPNLLTMEGIRGNEYTANGPEHNLRLPFTRFMAGAADYTVCFRNPGIINENVEKVPNSKGHQLALGMIMFSPLQHLLWYGYPHEYTNETEIEYFTKVPTFWDETILLQASLGNNIAIARRKGDTWHLALANNAAQTMSVPLSFLSSEQKYKVLSYTDKPNAKISKQEYTPTDEAYNFFPNSELTISLQRAGGAVYIFSPLDIDDLPKPQITTIGAPQLCNGMSTSLEASSGFDTYLWSNGETTRTINITQPGEYSVAAKLSNMNYRYSDPVYIHNSPSNIKPVVVVTPYCEQNTVLLSAPTGFKTYNWSGDNRKTQTIEISAPGVYSLAINDITGCLSSASTPIQITTDTNGQLVAPEQTISYCNGEKVRISGPTNFDSYKWNTNATTQSIQLATDQTFQLQFQHLGKCQSVSSNIKLDYLTSTIQPSFTFSATEACEGEAIQCQPTEDYKNILWSNLSNNSTIDIFKTSKVHLDVFDEKGCKSTSDTILLTLNARPEKPIITQTGRELTVESANNFVTWYQESHELPNETSEHFTPESFGNYSVRLENPDGCSTTSDTFSYHTLGNERAQQLSIYPNPVQKDVYIQRSSPTDELLNIFTLAGKLIHQSKLTKTVERINLSALPQGIYILRVGDNTVQLYKQ